MIYFLKFGASFLLPPGLFFLCLWALAFYLWKRAKGAAVVLLALTTGFYLLSTELVANQLMGNLENVYEQPANPQGDVIVMLGGGATADTPNLGEQGNLCAVPAARLLTTADLYHRLHVPVLLSGGQVYADSGREAVIARRELMRLGVPEDQIITETESLNTRLNAKYSAVIMRERGLEHPVLVTSAFHMERSMLNFAKEGYEAVPCPTEYRVNRHQVFHYNKLMPMAAALDNSVTFFREKLRTFVTRYFE